HGKRSKEAFKQLIGQWEGILVSDGYGVYKKWVNSRQTCLSHLIRRAKELAESSNPELSKCGEWALRELRTLVHMARVPPSAGQWSAFYARLCRLIALYCESKSEAGEFVRRLEEEMEPFFAFLVEEGVEPTNNLAERTIRFRVLWRKRSQGTRSDRSDKGCRWVELILSLRHTCRLQCRSTFNVFVDAFSAYFKGQKPDLE
ncbi:MAG: transposase, partial [Deltaproteobacteria bacterium]|nr:transposase [Deltaproteobacteria bacterium]